jgi:ubiquinone/menaquinone biosynthesis C-methylase UbiE
MKIFQLNNSSSCLLFYSNDKDFIIEKVNEQQPHIIWFTNVTPEICSILPKIRPITQLIVGNVDSILTSVSNIKAFDIIFCSDHELICHLRNSEITTYFYPNFFEQDFFQPPNNNQNRIYPITLIGDLNKITNEYKQFFEFTSKNNLIQWWGNSIQTLPDIPFVQNIFNGNASKRERYSIFYQSRIIINPNIDNNYNNRLFEAAGCGALLISENSDYLYKLFEIGKEIIVYRNPKECIDLIRYYQNHHDEAHIIAKAGQKRTLKDHTFDTRITKTVELLERHLRYKKEINHTVPINISHSYKNIHKNQIEKRLTKSWQSEKIPVKQRGLTQKELNQMYQGKPPIVFQAMKAAMHPITKPNLSVLEIGCSTGYYYEILEYLLNMQINYTAGDYSFPMIQMAKDYYPNVSFHVFDGAFLPYADQSFDIVISSCVLLHTPDYQAQILETARITKDYIVAHRTPICKRKATSYFTKYAYDVETVELKFNENEFISEFQKNGFDLINDITLSENRMADTYDITYVFKKMCKPYL